MESTRLLTRVGSDVSNDIGLWGAGKNGSSISFESINENELGPILKFL